MNADMLKRVVRAIANGSQVELSRLASRIVESERQTGHTRLAEELDAILKRSRSRERGPVAVDSGERQLKELPTSRRHGESLVSIFSAESLEHHMVLPPGTEERFARIEKEFAARDRLGQFGLRPRKTILLYGPPGCGKSLGAKRLAWKTGLPLMKVRFDALLSSYFGESATNLRALFSAAQERPCVLLLDECDFIARSRATGKDIGEASRIVNSLLQLMEEYEAPGLLVATTNMESSLDSALFRRFDDVFFVPPPGPEEVRELLQGTLSSVKQIEFINWENIVTKLAGASAAMVVKAAQDAAKAAVLAGGKGVTEQHMLQAVSDIHQSGVTREE